MDTTQETRPRRSRQAPIAAAITGAICLLGALSAFVWDRTVFLNAWLFAVLCGVHTGAGALIFIFIHEMTGGRWGNRLRPYFVALVRTLPVFLLLLIPLFFFLPELFPWAQAGAIAQSEVLQKKQAYLNIPAFIVREGLVIGFIIFLSILTLRLNRRDKRPVALGPAGLISLALAMFFFSVDWFMSLEPKWVSTAFPAIIMIAQSVAGFAFAQIGHVWLARPGRDPESANREPSRAIGSMTLGIIILWTYTMFAQFLIIWSSDWPNEIDWYLIRSGPFWKTVIIGLALFHFLIPFFLLINTGFKTRPRYMAAVTLMLLFGQYVYVAWLVAPALHVHALSSILLYPLALVGIVGLQFGFFSRQLAPALANKTAASHG